MLRVLVVADDARVRTELAAQLTGQPGLAVEQTGLEDDLPSTAVPFDSGVIIWDLGDEAEGTAADFSTIHGLGVPVIVLGNDEERTTAAVAAGARGALPRGVSTALLLAAVQAVREGLVVIDPVFARGVLRARGEVPDAPADDLTVREAEVLQLLAEGMANKQIALRLGISDHTVKAHVDAILSKLGAHSRTEAVTRAVRLGLVVL